MRCLKDKTAGKPAIAPFWRKFNPPFCIERPIFCQNHFFTISCRSVKELKYFSVIFRQIIQRKNWKPPEYLKLWEFDIILTRRIISPRRIQTYMQSLATTQQMNRLKHYEKMTYVAYILAVLILNLSACIAPLFFDVLILQRRMGLISKRNNQNSEMIRMEVFLLIENYSNCNTIKSKFDLFIKLYF